MREMSDTEWAYLAGFIDADGCISLTQNKRGEFRFQIVVSQSNKSILDYWQAKTGVGGVSIASGTLGAWQWQIGKPECDEFLRALYPYLLLKKDEAAIAMRFRETFDKQGRYTKPSARIIRERMACVQAMRERKDGRRAPQIGYNWPNVGDAMDVNKPAVTQLPLLHIAAFVD